MKWRLLLFLLTIITISVFLYSYLEAKQEPAVKIGVLMIGDSRQEKLVGLKKGLADLGFKKEGITYFVKSADDREERLEGQIEALLKEKPDLIVTLGGIETLELKSVLEKHHLGIPVVFAGVAAPKETGLIKDYHAPGGLFTGINNYHTSLSGKRLEILHDLVPSLQRIHVLYDGEIKVSRLSMENAREAAGKLGIEIISCNVSDPDFLEKIQKDIQKNDGVLLLPGYRIEALTNEISALAKKHHLPVLGLYEYEVQKGMLASYGASFYDQGYQAARFASLIMQGNSPGELPVELPDSIDFLVNKQVKDELGLSLDKNLVFMADFVGSQEKEGGSPQ